MNIISDQLFHDTGIQNAVYTIPGSADTACTNYGWVCPKCGRVLAPFMPYCFCNGEGVKVQATTGTDSKEAIR